MLTKEETLWGKLNIGGPKKHFLTVVAKVAVNLRGFIKLYS